MTELRDRVESEYEAIQKTLDTVPPVGRLAALSMLELAGVATLAEQLKPFLAFRHFFSHAYALDLDLREWNR